MQGGISGIPTCKLLAPMHRTGCKWVYSTDSYIQTSALLNLVGRFVRYIHMPCRPNSVLALMPVCRSMANNDGCPTSSLEQEARKDALLFRCMNSIPLVWS